MNQRDLTRFNGSHARTLSGVKRCAAVVALLSIFGSICVSGTSIAAGNVPSPVVPLNEGFEASLGAFTSFSIGCATTHCLWGSVTTAAHSGSHSAFASDVAEAGDDDLELVSGLAIPPDASTATLSFYHKYGFESSGATFFDGGVLEVSVDGGTTFADAGANIISGGYQGTLNTGHMNPLEGRSAWVGDHTAAFTQVQVNLMPYRGSSLLFRLRLGTDSSNGAAGWWVDDVVVSYTSPSAPCGRAWSTVSNYPIAIRSEALVSLGDSIYSFGGKTGANSPTAASYKYDASTDSWSPIASLPTAVYGASAVTDGTDIYVVGGANASNTPSNVLWRYDPSANTYTTLAPFTTATTLSGAAYLNGRIYRVAGSTDPNNSAETTTVEAYTIATNAWNAVASYPGAYFGMSVIALNGYIYAAGGAAYLGGTAKAYRYDPASNAWDDGQIADLPAPGFAMGSALYNGRWLLAPDSSSTSQNSAAWTPGTNTWSSIEPLPVSVAMTAGAAVHGAFYVVGGYVFSASVNTVQKYVETSCTDYTPLAPARLADTRPDGTTVDGLFAKGGKVAAGATLALTVDGRGGVPGDAGAVALNVTVTEADGPGFVTVFPCGSPQPTASNLNFERGGTIPNAVISKVGSNGQVCLFSSQTVHLVVDVDGSFPPTSSYHAINPARLLESRPGLGTVDGQQQLGATLPTGSVTAVRVTGRAGVPSDAGAVVLNVTVTGPAADGFVTVYPCGGPPPTASNLNYSAGETIPNLAISKIGANGTVCVFNQRSTDLVVDVLGYFPASSSFTALLPARLLDTRANTSTVDGLLAGGGPATGNTVTTVKVAGRGGVPANASTAVLNVTVTNPVGPGFATVFPCGIDPPLASNLNYVGGQTIPNAVLTKIGTNGDVCIIANQSTDLIVDVNGYFP